MVGLTALGCADRSVEDDAADEAGSSESSASESTFDTSPQDTDEQPSDEPSPSDTESTDGDTTTESTTDTSTDTTDTTDTSTDTSTTDSGDIPGTPCQSDGECAPLQCYVFSFFGGQCGECNEDADCSDGGCTPHNPFQDNSSSVCNMGELGGGCESDDVCMPGLLCGNALDVAGLIQINSCGTCTLDSQCMPGDICAPLTQLTQFSGHNDCIAPGSLPHDAFCLLEGNGNQACASGLCSAVDIRGLTQLGSCGDCNTDADCNGGICVAGEFGLTFGTLTGSTCQ